MRTLVTGVAGFIGSAVADSLLAHGEAVIGVDNCNAYYDPALKAARLARVAGSAQGRFRFIPLDISSEGELAKSLSGEKFDRIVHLAAQPGVRYSLENPGAYVRSNLVGHANILEFARHAKVGHLVYASSSSVYGGSTKLPFGEADRVDRPVSLYAATKKADELMSETYAHLFRLSQTGLRFFTVYGPWGRPDMMPWLFTSAILAGRPIDVFNHGRMQRDFTYIDDIVAGVLAVLERPPADDGTIKPGGSAGPHAIYNIGNNRSEKLLDVLAVIEHACGAKAEVRLRPMQPGDVEATFADITAITRDAGFAPKTTVAEGMPRFVRWYRKYHGA